MAEESVRAVDRALEILLAFTARDGELTVSEIVKRVDLSRPTLYRLLRTLEGNRFLVSTGDPQRFRLGPSVAQLANAYATGAVSVGNNASYVGGLIGFNAVFDNGAQVVASGASGAVTAGNVHVAIDGRHRGSFVLAHALRPETGKMIGTLSKECELALLSGDNERERARFEVLFGPESPRDLGCSAAMALMWIGSFYLYGIGTSMVGTWGKVIGWPVFICLAIGVGVLGGWWKGEWRQAPRPPPSFSAKACCSS